MIPATPGRPARLTRGTPRRRARTSARRLAATQCNRSMAETPQTPPLPSEVPVVPLRGAVVLPMTVAPLGVSRGMSVEAVNRALAGDRMILLLLQKNEGDEPAADDLHRVGTVAMIRQMAKAPAGMRVLVEGLARVSVEELKNERGYFIASI